MSDRFPTVYNQTSLDTYNFGRRFLIYLADIVFYTLIKVIGLTIRFETEGEEHLELIRKDGKVPILCFWHDRIFSATYYFRGQRIVVLTSASFDGEYIARFIKRFGYGAIRGSSTRGGVRGLVEMIRLMRYGVPMGFTVDGPRGPRYKAKSGPAMLAKKTGCPIVPFIIEPRKYWSLSSWDKLQIPKPFTKARLFLGSPIYVSSIARDEDLEQIRLELQNSLDDLVAHGEKWSTG